MTLEELVTEIKHHDFWYKEDFAKILSACNEDIGSAKYFFNLMTTAHVAKILTPVSLEDYEALYPMLEKSPLFPVGTLNFKYSPSQLVGWAMKKNFKLPEEFYPKLYKENHELDESEREVVYTMLLGIAKDKFHYDPKKERNDATGENKYSIKASLERKGYSIGKDTVRKYLRKAVQLIDG